jgi:trigger factor
MNTTQTQKGEHLVSIKINIVKADYEQKVNDSLKKLQHKANVRGFRPGKVPFAMVKKMYGSSALMEELNTLISESLNKCIVDNKLDLIGYPLNDLDQAQPTEIENQEELDFYFEAALRPEITVDYGKMDLDFYDIVASDEEVDKTIENIIERNPIITYPEKVGENDKLELKINEADEQGKEIDNGFKKTIHIHMSQIVDHESKEALIGKETGSEFIFNFTKALGSEEAAEKVLGQDAPADSDFNIIIDEITGEEKPELNEEFFEKIFPKQEVKDIENFKQKVKAEMEKQYMAEADRILFNKFIDKLIDNVEFSLPDAFMKRWMFENGQGKVTKEDIEKNYESNYVKGLRWQLIEDAIVKANMDLVVTDEEVRDFMKKQFFPGLDYDTLDDDMKKRLDDLATNLMKHADQLENAKNQLADLKMTKFLKSKIKINAKKVSYEEFVKELSEK